MNACCAPCCDGSANSARISLHAPTTAFAFAASINPSFALASAAQRLRRTCASICICGTGLNDTGKFNTARCVVAPCSRDACTCISPIESASIRFDTAEAASDGEALGAVFEAGILRGVFVGMLIRSRVWKRE